MTTFTLLGSSTTARTLTSGETGYIAQNGSLATSTDAIVGSGSNDVTIFGTVYSSVGNAIDFNGTFLDVVIGPSGAINAAKSDTIRVSFTDSFSLSNDGFIGSGDDAIDVRENDGSGEILILNSGTISAKSDAIVTQSGTDKTTIYNYGQIIGGDGGIDHLQGLFVLVNYGNISGSIYGVDGSDDVDVITNHGSISGLVKTRAGDDYIINRGTMGSVQLGDGADTFDGRSGDVSGVVEGGDGNDIYIVSDADINLVELADEGLDHVKAKVSFTLASFIEDLTLIGSGNFNGTGNADANTLKGNGGDNILRGLNGADKIFGRSGDDRIFGGKGNDNLVGGSGDDFLRGGVSQDILSGGDGNDTLFGGTGKDVLTGGAGEDVFVFARANHSVNTADADEITDFEIGVDRIDLSGLNVDLIYFGSAGFSGSGAEVRVTSGSTSSTIRVDVDGDGSADMKIKLTDTLGVTEIDFIL